MEEKPRIVILDDNEIFAALLVAALETDCDIRVGRNGYEGRQLCLAGRTDLLITDIGMPEFDGIQMLAEFQKDRRLANIPVIVVTATHFSHRSRSEVSRYPQVCCMLSKTSDIEILTMEIRKALQAFRGSGPAAQ